MLRVPLGLSAAYPSRQEVQKAFGMTGSENNDNPRQGGYESPFIQVRTLQLRRTVLDNSDWDEGEEIPDD